MADYMMNRRDKGPPSPPRERKRIGAILIGTALGFFFLFNFQQEDIGGAARLGLGTWLTTLGVVDLVCLATGDVERIFLKTRKGSTIAAISYLTGGLVLVTTGVIGIL